MKLIQKIKNAIWEEIPEPTDDSRMGLIKELIKENQQKQTYINQLEYQLGLAKAESQILKEKIYG